MNGNAASDCSKIWNRNVSEVYNMLIKPALNCPSFRKQSGVKVFAQPGINEFSESEVMCVQVWWPILWICALHLTHPSAHTHSSEHTHTHTVNIHLEQWVAIYAAAPGDQLGVRCLAQGSHLSRGIEGGRERWLFTPKSKWLDNWNCLSLGGIKKRSEFLSL